MDGLEIGNRMKEFYENVLRTRLMRRCPVALRMDGKAFKHFTENFKKPYDRLFRDTMQETMLNLCQSIQGCVLGYTQSDEITLSLVDAPYNWIVFDYTGKPNLPEMIKVRRPNKLCAGTIFAKTDYEFANNKSKEKSKTGGIVELKGKGKYSGTMKVKIYVNNAEIKTSDVPPITISKDDFKDGKYIKQLNAPKVYGITKEALSTLKCEFRLAKENSEAVSIDSKTGKTVKNNTKRNISVSPEGTLTIKSTEKETYVVECIITADHYKTLAKSIYIYVE